MQPRALDEPAFVGMQVQGMSDEIGLALGLPNAHGVLVRDISLGGPSDRAGFKRGDIIVKFDGNLIDSFPTMLRVVGKTKARDNIDVTLIRDSREMTVRMLTGRWAPSWQIAVNASAAISQSGVTVMALTDDVKKRFNLPWGVNGLVVSKVEPDVSSRTDLQIGEVIVQVNQRQVWEPRQLREEIKRASESKRPKALLLVRGVNGFRFSLLPIN